MLFFTKTGRTIDSLDKLEAAAVNYGMLPFFRNSIKGFSVEEMTVPGYLFGDDGEDCWTWKGPVIERQSTAYGKFFRKKAGFVGRSLLPDFLNYRRWRYPVAPGSIDAMLLDIISDNEALTSTELRKIVAGKSSQISDAMDTDISSPSVAVKRHSLEGPLQRLQMGGWLLIADFQYKLTRTGERYGWGVALYSTPEIWFDTLDFHTERTPAESLEYLVESVSRHLRFVPKQKIRRLIE